MEKWEEKEGEGWEVEGGRREEREEDGEEETLNRKQEYVCSSQDPQFNPICKTHFSSFIIEFPKKMSQDIWGAFFTISQFLIK